MNDRPLHLHARRTAAPVQRMLVLAALCVAAAATEAHPPIDLGPGNTSGKAINYAGASVTLKDGTLLSFYRRGAADSIPIYVTRSTDHGTNWTAPEVLVKLSTERWGGPIPLLDRDEELHFVIPKVRGEGRIPNVDRFIDLYYLRSTNGRAEWTEPKRIYEGYCGSIQGLFQLNSGRIVAPFADWLPGVARTPPTGPNVTTAVYSDTDGRTWKRSPAKLTAPCHDGYNGANYGACEPTLIELNDERVWMLIRTQAGDLYESFSPNGANWSEAQPSRFVSSNSPAFPIRLNDGRIVLFWNNCVMPPRVGKDGVYAGRDALHAAISRDEGKSWRGFREVYRDPTRHQSPPQSGDRGTAYPHATLTDDGRILLVSGQGTERRRRFLIDPEWLLERTHEETFENIDAWHLFKEFGPVKRWWRDRLQGPQLIDHPDKPGRKALQIRRPDALPADGAVWNFPSARAGKLTLRVRIGKRFGGARISVTDRFYNPCDDAGKKEAPISLNISPGGRIVSHHTLTPDKWQTIDITWNSIGVCKAFLDGKLIRQFGSVRHPANGFCYLRLRSTSTQVDPTGLLVDSVKMRAQ
ncbi:MAG: sialidase family protein [Verrucomicrobiia bacterium]